MHYLTVLGFSVFHFSFSFVNFLFGFVHIDLVETLTFSLLLPLPKTAMAPSGEVLAKNSGGALPHQPLHHRVHFFRSPNRKKYELHICLHFKSIQWRSEGGAAGADRTG